MAYYGVSNAAQVIIASNCNVMEMPDAIGTEIQAPMHMSAANSAHKQSIVVEMRGEAFLVMVYLHAICVNRKSILR